VHQIKFRRDGKRTYVSCDCRAVLGKHSRNAADPEFYEPMPFPQEGERLFDVYNKPENHNEPFTERDRIRI